MAWERRVIDAGHLAFVLRQQIAVHPRNRTLDVLPEHIMRLTRFAAVVVCVPWSSMQATGGPFENLSVSADSSEIAIWANEVVTFNPTSSGSQHSDGTNALGFPDEAFASLGDLSSEEISNASPAGEITVSFAAAISDGPGWDFAVFENAGPFFEAPFVFAELAFVEVSSNGADFSRFPSSSLNVEPGQGTPDTELITPLGRNFAGLNTTNINNLAGIHPLGFGTAFDLSDLTNNEEVLAGDVDVSSIRFVRFVDIPGNGSRFDSQGRPVLDAWPTSGGVGGIDVDAVGARHLVRIPGDVNLDGIVDALDFNIWNVHRFTFSDAWTDGDLNRDGLVDVSDFNIWNDNRTKFTSRDSVPEPASNVILLLGIFANACRSLALKFAGPPVI